MSGVVAKMFIQSVQTDLHGSRYTLGVVCRGEENKDWSAATPSGTAVLVGPVLDEVWAARQADPYASIEVLVFQHPDPDGEFEMRSCDFSYGGCAVKFHRNGGTPPYGLKLEFTVNAKPASKVLRDAYAEGLMSGVAPRFRIEIERATSEA